MECTRVPSSKGFVRGHLLTIKVLLLNDASETFSKVARASTRSFFSARTSEATLLAALLSYSDVNQFPLLHGFEDRIFLPRLVM